MSDKALSTYVQSNVTSYVGHNATLPCLAPSIQYASVVEWTRRDTSNQYVLLARDGHLDPGNQNPNFRNRVGLVDRKMKYGDLSLNLRNIQPSDSGIYECRFKEGDGRRRKRGVLHNNPVSVVSLEVDKVQYITARPGHNVILPCRAPEDVTVDALEWTRSDLEPEEYIFLVRDGIPDTTKQHPSFKNRVELMDSELKNGNLHLIVKNVTISDTGRYECRLKDGVARLLKRAAIKNEPVSIIELKVTDSELTNEGSGDENDTLDEEDTDIEEDTDKKNPNITVPKEEVSREHYGLIACVAGFAFLYVVMGILALL